MKNAKHTPGRWFVECLETMRMLELAEDTPIVSSGIYPNQLTHVVCLGGHKTALANAHLIAAAPKLLSNLKRAVEYFEANGGEREYTWLADMKDAIAKAEGSKE